MKLAKNSFHNFIQELVPDIDIVNSLAVGSNSNKIYNLMVSEQAVDVSFEEITSFCSAGEFTLEAVQHKSQELDAALWELKDACMTMKIDLFRVLAEVDKDRRGFVPHEIFTKHLITRQLVKKPETANLIANSFKPKLSKKVNIEKLVAQVNKLEINDTGAQKDRIRNSFIKLAQTKKCRLRDLFNSHCLEKKMDYGQFKDLIMEAGEANTPNFLLESIFKNDLKAYNNVITIYKFLSMFDKANRTKELAILFANHAPLFNFLRESCQKDNTTFYRKYVKASYTSTFIQEIEKLKIPETIKPDIKGFTELLESTAQPNQIDQLALQMLDESFEKGMDVALLHKPPTNPDIDEISKMSFTDLQEIQKDIKLFDDAIKEDKLDFEGMMKKYDTKKDGLIHEKDFM